jgi:hypothetical protein
VANKTGATRLGFALLLKFFELNARFAVSAGELSPAAVDYVARQVDVDPGELARYAWSGRTIEYHRAQIRQGLGFREASRADEARLTDWLAENVAAGEPSDERLREALPARCRSERLEPPGRPERIVASGRSSVSRLARPGSAFSSASSPRPRLGASSIGSATRASSRTATAAGSRAVTASEKRAAAVLTEWHARYGGPA